MDVEVERSQGQWGMVEGTGGRGVDGIHGTSQVSCECGHVM